MLDMRLKDCMILYSKTSLATFHLNIAEPTIEEEIDT